MLKIHFYTLLIVISYSAFYSNAQDIYERKVQFSENDSSFTWTGEWSFEQGTDAGKIVMTVKIFQDSNSYKGWHCMTDGRIMGGAIDCADRSEDRPQYTLTNSTSINPNTLEFDFTSGYIPRSGKARLIKVNDTTIRFIVTTPPVQFNLSPLANYLFLNEGIGSNASGGIKLIK